MQFEFHKYQFTARFLSGGKDNNSNGVSEVRHSLK